MRYLLIKNKKLYKSTVNIELKRLFYKSIIYNENLPVYLRQKVINKLDNLYLKNGTYVKIRNRCYITNRSRSVYKFFKLSRIKLRWLISNNYINAVKKSS